MKHSLSLAVGCVLLTAGVAADDWPRWRGPGGRAVSDAQRLPLHWGSNSNVVWSTRVPGEGTSSPIVSGGQVYLTAAEREGLTRALHCFAGDGGKLLWTARIPDDDPELTSAVTGHAAPTPVTDGERVVAFFGNAGVVCVDTVGEQIWHRDLGDFETELGIASSPILHEGRVLLVCDHDGDRFSSFDSFLVALDVTTGETAWRTARPDLYRSWSTPVVVPAGEREELVVCAQDEIRGYDPHGGELLWRIGGLTGWVTPSPVYSEGRVFVTSGKNGPVLAARPGGRGDVTSSHVVWKREREGAYVTSPVAQGDRLWVIRQNGILTCYRASDGERLYRQRLDGKFTASPIAGAGHVYFLAESGTTHVVRAADTFELVASNDLGEYTVASPAVADGDLFIRTESRLYRIGESEESVRLGAAIDRAVAYLSRAVAQWPEENGCFSCHNNGDAARALFAARGASLDVSDSAWKSTLTWLRSPDRWTMQEGFRDYSDPDLARVQFAAALESAAALGIVEDAETRARAASLVVEQQQPDGSWNGGSKNPVGSPTAWSRHLATFLARSVLVRAAAASHGEAIARADDWLQGKSTRNVHDAAVQLLAGVKPGSPRFEKCLEILRAGRSSGGAWGPYTNAAPEVFDTALVVLALVELQKSEALAQARREKLLDWVRDARRYLVETQEPDGGWLETTRPAGEESYAQHVSTTAWALQALIASREVE